MRPVGERDVVRLGRRAGLLGQLPERAQAVGGVQLEREERGGAGAEAGVHLHVAVGGGLHLDVAGVARGHVHVLVGVALAGRGAGRRAVRQRRLEPLHLSVLLHNVSVLSCL